MACMHRWISIYLILHCHGAATNSPVDTLLDDFFTFRMRESPEYAGKYGLPFYMEDVEEWSEEAFNRRLRDALKFKDRANLLVNQHNLSQSEKLNLKILKYVLDTYITGYNFRQFTSGFNADLLKLPSVLEWYTIDTEEKLRYWYTRMNKYTPTFKTQSETLPSVMSGRYTIPCVTMSSHLKDIERIITDDTESFFAFQPWKRLNISDHNMTFYEEGKTASLNLLNTMKELRNVIRSFNTTGCRATTAASALVGGDEFYKAAVRWHTAKDMTPEKVHQIGLEEVQRITNDINQIIEKAGFQSLKEYVKFLKSQPNETFNTSDDVIRAMESALQDVIRPKLPLVFDDVDQIPPLEVVNSPGHMGFYKDPSADGKRPAQFLTDARKPREMLRINVLPLALHEGIPGHHLHTSVSIKLGLHNFRKLIEFRHYVQTPFNWPHFTSWSEGWGLYAETLGEDLGIIEGNKARVGLLGFQSLRAVRLVVDTGLHYYNWTFEQAKNYMLERTTLSEDECSSQVTRYINWPGQALSYQIGFLKIRELRKLAEEKLGKGFNVKEFHKVVLNTGPCSLEIVEDEVNVWIEAKMLSSSAASFKQATIAAAICTLSYIFV